MFFFFSAVVWLQCVLRRKMGNEKWIYLKIVWILVEFLYLSEGLLMCPFAYSWFPMWTRCKVALKFNNKFSSGLKTTKFGSHRLSVKFMGPDRLTELWVLEISFGSSVVLALCDLIWEYSFLPRDKVWAL